MLCRETWSGVAVAPELRLGDVSDGSIKVNIPSHSS